MQKVKYKIWLKYYVKIGPMNKEEVLKLAKLARIEMGADEAENLAHEFEAILGYVDEIKGASHSAEASRDRSVPTLRNVMREDANPHESGIYTEDLLNEVPSREQNLVKVKKIL